MPVYLFCSAGDDSPDSLAIVQATIKDQGMYQCKLKNPNGKMSSEFRLTSEGEKLSNIIFLFFFFMQIVH